MFDKRIYWLWLIMVFGPANPRIWQIGERFSDAETMVRSLVNDTVKGLPDDEKKKIKSHKPKDAEKLLNDCENSGIKVYCYESEDYPKKLRRIANPPSVLFCYGSLDFLNDKICIAVVGTRNPSEYSLNTTRVLCKQLLERDFYLVSGFASGIDMIANETSIENDMYSAAVMGVAVDEDYPKGSSDLKMQIAGKGVVISEYCSILKTPPSSFVQRNRILIGLSDGVLFCECSENSKGLNNVKHAEMQGKPIFVIPPHDILDSRYSGQCNLIRNGATAVFSGGDIAAVLAYQRFENMNPATDYKLASDNSVEFDTEEKPRKKRRAKKNKLDDKESEDKTDSAIKNTDFSSLNENQRKICEILQEGRLLVDEIVFRTGYDVSLVLSELIELELEGMITAYPGKVYGLSK